MITAERRVIAGPLKSQGTFAGSQGLIVTNIEITPEKSPSGKLQAPVTLATDSGRIRAIRKLCV
jgi:hypothetical protein